MTSRHDETRSGAARPRRSGLVVCLLGAVVLFAVLAFLGISERSRNEAALAAWTDRQAIPSVDLVSPQKATENHPLTLPADVEAFYTAPIHSRVNGYVAMWYDDIGARVKAGTVLARIETPDLDQRYEQVRGDLGKAQADYNLALLTADRWKALRASQAVSQQAADEKIGDAVASKAQVAAAQAKVDRVKAEEAFKEIVAPFDGTVTQRNIDVGALVSATNVGAKPLFQVASTQKMRVYVRVPQVYASHMRVGMPVSLRLPQYVGKVFTGRLETTSDAISKSARALTVEAIFPNPDGLLRPGAYAQARFELPLDPDRLVVPASTMILRDKIAAVAVVDHEKVRLQTVQILIDTGSQIEVGGALEPSDRIVLNPSDSIATGDEVRVETVDGKPADASGGGARVSEDKSASAR